MQKQTEFYVVEFGGTSWNVPTRYRDLQPVGHGAYGSVCSAWDNQLNHKVAIKKLARPFQTDIHAKRTYREIKMLRHMDHDNIIILIDLFSPNNSLETFEDVYMVTPLMGADLNAIVRTQTLSDEHVQFLIYQILRGLKYLHSANIIHRDLKPSNIAVNEDCELRILDLGLARQRDDEMTGYVATRWYRAPEIMLQWMKYDRVVDIWSVGCIMVELINRHPLFPGMDHIDQLMKILSVTGFPEDDFLRKIESSDAITFLNNQRGNITQCPLASVCPGASPTALDLLKRMLTLDPTKRVSAAEALEHPYLAAYHDPDDEPDAVPYSDEWESQDLSVSEWRQLVWGTISEFTEPHLGSLANN
ncbi:hypothetical protein BOX15_Mlig000451g2 [Macrostomum lignano]|uniref:Uncharacterized protein n=2 Tax=Macrostomum lignano TaxID=282301 RepID=A0A267GFJ9_9PLAT|nr:hypothetical protein BOX15_Mlig000451g1 [Macrostomum lignano]PAA83982.1 hypothetical protein BOX15_Mlig000451g2 [Macrostomum lignano]